MHAHTRVGIPDIMRIAPGVTYRGSGVIPLVLGVEEKMEGGRVGREEWKEMGRQGKTEGGRARAGG